MVETVAAPTPALVALLLADARLPVAGHTQSGGLEPALAHGLRAQDIPDYLGVRLETVTRVEAGTAVVALHRLRVGLDLDPVVEAWAARTASPALRENARTQGRAYLRLLLRLWPDSPGVRRVAQVARPPRPLVLAAAALSGGLTPRDTAHVVGYDDVQTVCAAALKLLPLDPADSVGWTLGALGRIEALADSVATITEPEQIPAAGAPQIEAWAQAHAVTSRRLFSA